MGEAQADQWLACFPSLQGLDDPAGRAVLDSAKRVSVPPGTVLFQEGATCENYLLLLEGSVRVQKVAENGREIVLYRVESGQACVLTTACLFACEHYPAAGIAETDVEGILIPIACFQAGLADSPIFRQFVFSAYAQRISDLILLVEEVAFRRVDVRLAEFLLGHADDSGRLSATHQSLAMELGTAREVVSRQLKEFERRGWVQLHRGALDVVDGGGLERLAEKSGV